MTIRTKPGDQPGVGYFAFVKFPARRYHFREKEDPAMFESIRSILNRSIQKLRIEPRLKEGKLFASWEQIIDPDLAGNVVPERLEGGILFLRVTSPVHLSEVKLRQKSLVKKINETLGEQLVSDFRVFLSGSTKG